MRNAINEPINAINNISMPSINGKSNEIPTHATKKNLKLPRLATFHFRAGVGWGAQKACLQVEDDHWATLCAMLRQARKNLGERAGCRHDVPKQCWKGSSMNSASCRSNSRIYFETCLCELVGNLAGLWLVTRENMFCIVRKYFAFLLLVNLSSFFVFGRYGLTYQIS